jgi:photosystem II stability/assembly factor-like uncharacterized protein
MIKIVQISFIVIIYLINNFSAFSQTCWEPTNGPYGGSCNVLKPINNEIYAGTDCGIFSTSDYGKTWNNKSAGLRTGYLCQYIMDIDIANNTMIAGTLDSGIYISNDFGNNWIPSNTGLNNPSDLEIYDVFVDGSTVLIGTNNGVYKTSNIGSTWTPSNIGISESNNISAIRFVKNGTSTFLATSNSIYKSNDNGFTWTNLNISFQSQPSSIISHAGALYVCDGGGMSSGIFKSVNNGTTWIPLSFDFALPGMLYSVGNYLYCGANNGTTNVTYVSSDGGVSWTNFTDKDFKSIILLNNQIVGGNYSGVYTWSNGTQNITNAGLGGASSTKSIFKDGNTIYSGNANGVYRTNDDGNTWLNISSGLPLNIQVNSITKSGNKLIIGTKGYGIYTSIDNGNTWIQSNSGLTINGVFYSDITTLFQYNGRVFMGAKENITFYNYASLFISDNGGNTWTKSSIGLSDNCNVSSITNFGSYIVIGTKDEFSPSSFNDGVYLSTNNGSSWLFDGLSGPVSAVCSSSTGYYASIADLIYSTSDMGNSWTSHTFNNGSVINTITIINNLIYTIQDNELHYLNNDNWTSFDSGCLGENRKCLISNSSGVLFIGASALKSYGGGYYAFNNGISKYNGVTNNVTQNEINNDLIIYPNPTSNLITIQVKEGTNQSFQLFDQMGREVMNGKLSGISTEVNLSLLSKGMYTLKIEGNYQPSQIVKE